MNNFLANSYCQFLSYWGISYALSEYAQWIVKDHYTKPMKASVQNALYHMCIFAIATQLYTISFLYTPPFLYAYQIFAAIVAITIFTDLYAMLIANTVTIYCVPFAWLAASCQFLPITAAESISATVIVYILAQGFYYLVHKIMNKEGMGAGDIDLMVFIASCTGFYGIWCTISVGSYLATAYGLVYLFIYRTKEFKLPLGTFLGFATLLFLTSDYYKPIFRAISYPYFY